MPDESSKESIGNGDSEEPRQETEESEVQEIASGREEVSKEGWTEERETAKGRDTAEEQARHRCKTDKGEASWAKRE
jgi:hypothetical protein